MNPRQHDAASGREAGRLDPGGASRAGAVLSIAAVAVALLGTTWSAATIVVRRSVLPELLGPIGVWLAPVALSAFVLVSGVLADRVVAFRRTTWRLGLAHLRIVAYGAFLLTVVTWIFLQPADALLVAAAAGPTGALVAAAVWITSRMARDRLPTPVRRIVRGLDILLANLLLCWIGLELGLRIIGAVVPSPLFARVDRSIESRLESMRYEPGFVRYGFPCNERGDYDEPPPSRRVGEGRPLVLSIGDSFAAGIVPHWFHFTTVCERALGDGVDVYNMGAPSIGPAEYLYLLRYEGLTLRPDVVVVNLFTGNDWLVDTMPSGGQRWLRSWLHRENVLSIQLPKRALAVARETARREADGAAGDLQGERGVTDRFVLEYDEIVEAFPWVLDPMLETGNSSADGFFEVEVGTSTSTWEEVSAPYPRLFRWLEEIARACGDIPLVVSILPMATQVDDDLYARVSARVPDLEQRDLPQRVLAEWLERRDIPFIDVLPRLRALDRLEDGRLHAYHRFDTHFNARGNRVAGEALAECLAPILGLRDDDS